jgi:hypothetical protein
MARRFHLALALLVLAPGLNASQEIYGAASAAAPWLKVPASARSVGMGEVSAALPASAGNMQSNPAALAGLTGQEVQLLHNSWILGASAENLAYGLPLGPGSLGLGVSYFGYGAIDKYSYNTATNNLEKNGTLRPYAMSANLAYARPLGRGLALGLSGRYLSQSLDGSASASTFAGDLGGQWATEGKGLSLGLAAQNLGGQLDGASLPMNFKAGLLGGFSVLDSGRLNLGADVNLPAADTGALSFGVGAELWAHPQLALRTGYKFARSSSLGGSVSAGLGCRFSWVELNYAFTTFGATGNANMLELVAHFGGPGRAGEAAVKEEAPAARAPVKKKSKKPKRHKEDE